MHLIRLGRQLGLPAYVVEQFPASEILQQRAYDHIEAKEQEDARLMAQNKPPKHYPKPGQAKSSASKQYAAWVNAFDI